MNSYDKDHTLDDCDKCLKKVGKANLYPVPFLYLDCNDKTHPDIDAHHYKQYFVCAVCLARGV